MCSKRTHIIHSISNDCSSFLHAPTCHALLLTDCMRICHLLAPNKRTPSDLAMLCATTACPCHLDNQLHCPMPKLEEMQSCIHTCHALLTDCLQVCHLPAPGISSVLQLPLHCQVVVGQLTLSC
jgi:hypothetical protein